MTEHAKRYNEDKIDLSLLPVDACEEECRVWRHGEIKYGRDNWKKLWGENSTPVILASTLRHVFAILRGEKEDPESGFYHAAHIRCNMAMLIYYYKQLEK